MRLSNGSKKGGAAPQVQKKEIVREPAKEKEFQEDLDKLVLLG